MANIFVIDAWNVCFKIPEIATLIPDQLETARNKFNISVKSYFSQKKITFKIIYDGQPDIYTNNSKRDPSIAFSRNPEKADDLIIRYVQKQSNKRGITVITSDKQLAMRAKDLGAKVLSSDLFISRLQKRNVQAGKSFKQDPQIGEDEINYWLNKFSDDDQRK